MPFPSAVQMQLNSGLIIAKDFILAQPARRNDGVRVNCCLWSGIGEYEGQVINPRTGATDTYNFEGAMGLVQIGEIPRVSNITVQNVDMELAPDDPQVELMVRTYDLRLAPITIWRGLFSEGQRGLVYPAIPRFVGWVDFADGERPEPEGERGWKLTLTSATQELTRMNAAKRSDRSQHERDSTDEMFMYAAGVGEWKVSWGKHSKFEADQTDVDLGPMVQTFRL